MTTLHSFGGSGDGAAPWQIILDDAGNLYGSASTGGASNAGAVFELKR